LNKKTIFLSVIIILAAVFAILISSMVVFVPEDKSVCVKRFNKIIAVHDESGLVLIAPFIDSVTELQKNALVYNLTPSDVLTLDKKAMTVSSYVVWKISDPLTYLQTLVTRSEAERRLDASVYNSVKNLLSSLNQAEAISSRGKDLNDKILSSVRALTSSYGIDIIDVQIKQFDLPPDNKDAVYNRMVSERQQIAAQYTAEGKEEAEKIKNTADREASLILSGARAQAEQIKAEGESEYMRILASAYKGDDRADFYEFIRSMDALKVAMTGDKTVFLPADSQLAKWFLGFDAGK
jgi:membrane protease subunit HflC